MRPGEYVLPGGFQVFRPDYGRRYRKNLESKPFPPMGQASVFGWGYVRLNSQTPPRSSIRVVIHDFPFASVPRWFRRRASGSALLECCQGIGGDDEARPRASEGGRVDRRQLASPDPGAHFVFADSVAK